MKQYFVEYNGRGASLLLGAEPERSNRPNGGGTAGGGGSTRTDGTFPFAVSLTGGAGRCGGTTGYTVLVTSVGTGSRARALVAPRAAREALGAPPSPSLDGLDTSLDGGSQHRLPEPHDAHQEGT